MNVKVFERNIKLQELGIEKLSIREQEILDFLNEKLRNLNTYTAKDMEYYSNHLFFGKNKDNILLDYNKKTGCLYVNDDIIWSFLESKFNMEYNDIQEVMGWWVVCVLHLEVNHVLGRISFAIERVGDILHLR